MNRVWGPLQGEPRVPLRARSNHKSQVTGALASGEALAERTEDCRTKPIWDEAAPGWNAFVQEKLVPRLHQEAVEARQEKAAQDSPRGAKEARPKGGQRGQWRAPRDPRNAPAADLRREASLRLMWWLLRDPETGWLAEAMMECGRNAPPGMRQWIQEMKELARKGEEVLDFGKWFASNWRHRPEAGGGADDEEAVDESVMDLGREDAAVPGVDDRHGARRRGGAGPADGALGAAAPGGMGGVPEGPGGGEGEGRGRVRGLDCPRGRQGCRRCRG